MDKIHTHEIAVIHHMICIRNKCFTVNAVDNQTCGNGPMGCGRYFPLQTQSSQELQDVLLVVDADKPFKKWFCIRYGKYYAFEVVMCETEGCAETWMRGGVPIWSEERNA